MGLYVIIFVIFLSSFCNAFLSMFKKLDYMSEQQYLNSRLKQDPVIFGCLYGENETKLKIVKSDDSNGMKDLINAIGPTPRGLSLYFLGLGSTIDEIDERFNATGWFKHSKTNICYVAYPYAGRNANILTQALDIRSMVESRRPEFVASVSRQFVQSIKKVCTTRGQIGCLSKMKQVTAVGWSLGAHIAAYFGRYIKDALKELILFILGLDPAAISFWVKVENYPRSGDATYVQIIHSTNLLKSSIGFIGTHVKTGDTQIIVSSDCPFWMVYSEHRLACYMHEVTASGTHIMVASKNKTDRVFARNKMTATLKEFEETLGIHECMVGVYNRNFCGKAQQKFFIKVTGPTCSFTSGFDVSHA